MPEAKASIRIAATPEAVFERIADLSTHGSWSAKAPLQVTREGDGPIGVGTTFRSTSRFMGKDVNATLSIVQHDAPKRLTFTATQDGDTFGHEFTLEPDGEGTRLTRTVTIPGGKGFKGFLAKYVAPNAVAKEAMKALEKLKGQIES